MTFREQCALEAMRELLREGRVSCVAAEHRVEAIVRLAADAFTVADAMVAASGVRDVPAYGAAPSRTARDP